MFSFLHKINSKKSSNNSRSTNNLNGLQADHPKAQNSKQSNKNADSSKDSHLTATSNLSPPIDLPKLKNEDNLLLPNHNHHHGSSTLSKFSLRKSFNLHQPAQPKSNFDRKSNLSLASFGSGYFTTGRRLDKKKSAASLGTLI